MTINELRKAYPNINESDCNFRYSIVGGNPRHFNSSASTHGSQKFVTLVKNCICNFFGVDYIDSNDYNKCQSAKWAINLISRSLSKLQMGNQLDSSSLFRQFDIDEDLELIGEIHSSVFLGVLIADMQRSTDISIIDTLKNVIGSSGFGFAFEYAAHRDVLNSETPYYCCKLSSKNIITNNMIISEFALNNKRKVLIRTIEDITTLRDGDYGLPTIPNFPLVDAIIPPNILVQMTTSKNHVGAINKLNDIAEKLKKPINELIMIFITTKESINQFLYVEELPDELQQFVTLSSPTTKSAMESLSGKGENKKNKGRKKRKHIF
jgi:hypothetical protein